jgi:RNA polymerase sigma-70 factor (ECF subfamily)
MTAAPATLRLHSVARPTSTGPAGGAGLRQADDDLAASLQRGDPDAIERTLHALLPRVRRWLFRQLGPRADLDDATQDALIEIVRALPKFEGRGSLAGMAHTISVRVAYRYFGRRADSTLEAVELTDEVDPEMRVAGREALAKLYRCLERLPEKRRVAFVLCTIDGLSPAEAAKMEGITALAMRSRLLHAREELGRWLKTDLTLVVWARSIHEGSEA